MMQWLRLYHDAATDPKWRVISRRSGQPVVAVMALWMLMLVKASEAADRGTLGGWDDEDAAAALDMEPEQVIAIREAMQGKVLDGVRLSGWERRQPKREREDTTATERKRQQRERERNESQQEATEEPTSADENLVTPCHASVTPSHAQIREEEIREDKKDPPLTPPPGDAGELFPEVSDSAIKTTRKDRAAKVAGEFADALERFKAAYPRRNHPHNWYGTSGAERRFVQAVRSGVDPEMIIAAAGRYAQQVEKDGIVGTHKVADALTWLNGKRWIGWNNVHELRPAEVEKSVGDKYHPPVGYDDDPVGKKRGWWFKSSQGWQRYAS